MDYHSHFQYAIELTAKNKYQEAINELTKALECNPRHFGSYLNRGTIFTLLKLWPLAYDDFSKAITVDPSDPTGYYNRFVVYAAMQKYRYALSDLYCSLSCFYVQRGKMSQDVKFLTKAISFVESNYFAYIERGEIYLCQGMETLALNEYSCALEIDPNNTRALCLRASLLRGLGELEKSRKDQEMAISLATSEVVDQPVLKVNLKVMSRYELLIYIGVRVEEVKELRTIKTELNSLANFSKSKSGISLLKDLDSTENIHIEVKNESYDNNQSLNSKLSKVVQSKVVAFKNDDQDYIMEKNRSLYRSGDLMIPKGLTPSEKSRKSSNNGASMIYACEGSDIASVEKRSSKESKKGSEIRKLADLVADDYYFGTSSLLIGQPRTPLASMYESKSMSSRLINSNSEVFKTSKRKNIFVEVVAAAITHSAIPPYKMYLYCTVIYDNEIKNTKVAIKSGKTPTWNYTLIFQVKYCSILKFYVWHKYNTKKDYFIGEGSLNIYQMNPKCMLLNEGEPAGCVFVKTRFT